MLDFPTEEVVPTTSSLEHHDGRLLSSEEGCSSIGTSSVEADRFLPLPTNETDRLIAAERGDAVALTEAELVESEIAYLEALLRCTYENIALYHQDIQIAQSNQRRFAARCATRLLRGGRTAEALRLSNELMIVQVAERLFQLAPHQPSPPNSRKDTPNVRPNSGECGREKSPEQNPEFLFPCHTTSPSIGSPVVEGGASPMRESTAASPLWSSPVMSRHRSLPLLTESDILLMEGDQDDEIKETRPSSSSVEGQTTLRRMTSSVERSLWLLSTRERQLSDTARQRQDALDATAADLHRAEQQCQELDRQLDELHRRQQRDQTRLDLRTEQFRLLRDDFPVRFSRLLADVRTTQSCIRFVEEETQKIRQEREVILAECGEVDQETEKVRQKIALSEQQNERLRLNYAKLCEEAAKKVVPSL